MESYNQSKVGVIPYTDDGFILLGLDARSANTDVAYSINSGWKIFAGVAFNNNLQLDAMNILYDKSRYAYLNLETGFYALRENDFKYFVETQNVIRNKLTVGKAVDSKMYIFFVRVPYRVLPKEIESHPSMSNTQAQVVSWTWVHASRLLMEQNGVLPCSVRNFEGKEIKLFLAFLYNLCDANVQANLRSIAQAGTIDLARTKEYKAPCNNCEGLNWDIFVSCGVNALERFYKMDLHFINVGYLFYNSSGNFALSFNKNEIGKKTSVAWSVRTAKLDVAILRSLTGVESWHRFFCDPVADIFMESPHQITHVVLADDKPFLLCLVYVPGASEDFFEHNKLLYNWVDGRSLIGQTYSSKSLHNEYLRFFCEFARVLSSPNAQAILMEIIDRQRALREGCQMSLEDDASAFQVRQERETQLIKDSLEACRQRDEDSLFSDIDSFVRNYLYQTR